MLLSDSFATTLNQPVGHPAGTSPAYLRPDQTYALYYKRAFDIWGTATILLLAAPFLLPIALILSVLISFDGYNPIFTQRRIGRHGRIFRMFKFRTMVHDADQRLEDYLAQNPDAREEWEKHQKLRFDPRITLVGRFLRKTSLDELPQLLNVLRGEMSLGRAAPDDGRANRALPRPRLLSDQTWLDRALAGV